MTKATAPGTVADEHDLLSVSAAARMLGVSSSSLRAWAAAGRVPHMRTPGGHRRFERAVLVEWLRARGSGPPAAVPRGAELVPTRVPATPEVAALMRRARSGVVTVFEEEVARTRAVPARSAGGRRARALEAIEAMAAGIEVGDLSAFLRDAEWEGFRHGAAGRPGDAPITEALALRRALDRAAVPHLDDNPEQRRTIERAMDRMAIRLAAGYADGVRARLRVDEG